MTAAAETKPGRQQQEHPQLQQVMTAIAQGESDLEISRKTGLDRTTIYRWRMRSTGQRAKVALVGPKSVAATIVQHLKQEGVFRPNVNERLVVSAAQQVATSALENDPFISEVLKRNERRERMLKKAEEKDDLRGFAAIDRNDLTALELHARLAGRLDGAPHGPVNNLFVIMSPKCEEVEPALTLTPSPQAIDTTCEPSEPDE